jgi:hypothetical protein
MAIRLGTATPFRGGKIISGHADSSVRSKIEKGLLSLFLFAGRGQQPHFDPRAYRAYINTSSFTHSVRNAVAVPARRFIVGQHGGHSSLFDATAPIPLRRLLCNHRHLECVRIDQMIGVDAVKGIYDRAHIMVKRQECTKKKKGQH